MARKRTEPQSRRPKSDVSGLTPGKAPAPDEIKLNAISAERLASLAGLEAQEIQGQTIASISEKLKWAIDPEWLFFRRVCGRVVKTDPDSGISYPVPYAGTKNHHLLYGGDGDLITMVDSSNKAISVPTKETDELIKIQFTG